MFVPLIVEIYRHETPGRTPFNRGNPVAFRKYVSSVEILVAGARPCACLCAPSRYAHGMWRRTEIDLYLRAEIRASQEEEKKEKGFRLNTVLCCAVGTCASLFQGKALHGRLIRCTIISLLICCPALFWRDGIGRHSGGDRDDDLISKWIDDTPDCTPKLMLKWSYDAVQEAYDDAEVQEVCENTLVCIGQGILSQEGHYSNTHTTTILGSFFHMRILYTRIEIYRYIGIDSLIVMSDDCGSKHQPKVSDKHAAETQLQHA